MKTIFYKLKNNPEFLKFLLVGGTAAAVNFCSRIILGQFMTYLSSIIVAYMFGILTAYLLCRQFVFQSKKNNTTKEVFFFILVNLFAILQTAVISVLLANYAFSGITNILLKEEIAHFIGICVPVISSYFGHKYLSFR